MARWTFATNACAPIQDSGSTNCKAMAGESMLHPDDRKRVITAWHESVANGTPYEHEQRHRGTDGRYRWFLARGVPLRDAGGRILRWYGTYTDIEDRKKAEEELRRLSGQFLRSQDEERRRIARDLHDSTGQDLVALATMLGQLSGLNSLPLSKNHIDFFPNVGRWRTSASAMSARFLTCCTRRCWTTLV